MTLIDLGNYSLSLALLVAVAALVAGIGAIRLNSSGFLNLSRGLIVVLAGLLTFSSALLMMALLAGDFRLEYVAHYTERALPSGYKAAAFWAGQSGSLLLWAWMLAVMNLLVLITYRGKENRETAATIAVLAVVTGFFTALMLFTANPFKPMATVPADGSGLNPMLQNLGMLAHPPLLFLGYAGYTIPFAMMIGAMVAGRRDSQWVEPIRRWSLFAWLFLTAGIVWGAQWAYTELGWGGYWAWDPVENASLLPWLTGTALLHSLSTQMQRGMFRKWNVSLIAASFLLCIFGTYLTRSGVVQSVHSFGNHPIGNFFVGFLIVSGLLSAAVLIWRRRELAPQTPLQSLVSREGAVLGGNVLLTLITLVVLVGTTLPMLSTLVIGRSLTVGQPFYNSVVAPMGLALAALMAFGPALRDGGQGGDKLLKSLLVPAIAALLIVAGLVSMGLREPWALIAALIVALVACIVVVELMRTWHLRVRSTKQNAVTALVAVIDGNHRRYGAQLTHLGMALAVAGIAGSSLFSQKQTLQFGPGESATVNDYTLTFNQLDEVRGPNYTSVAADITVAAPDGTIATIRPQRKFFDKAEDGYSEVAIQSTWRQDLYVVLAGWESGGKVTAVQAIINPLVSWIWIGGIVMVCGALFCMLPRLLPQPRVEPRRDAAPLSTRSRVAQGVPS